MLLSMCLHKHDGRALLLYEAFIPVIRHAFNTYTPRSAASPVACHELPHRTFPLSRGQLALGMVLKIAAA